MRLADDVVRMARSVLDFVFPRSCCVCGRALYGSEEVLCAECLWRLPRLRYSSVVGNALWTYLNEKEEVERAMSLFVYKPGGVMGRVVHDFKYRHHPDTARYMGRMLGRELLPTGFFEGIDVMVPMPITRSRRRERGYNQSEELGRGVSEVTGVGMDVCSVQRRVFARSQTRLSAEERRENLRGAFRIVDVGRLLGRHVLLIDDVITTGATMCSCIGAMRESGVSRISVLSLARTE